MGSSFETKHKVLLVSLLISTVVTSGLALWIFTGSVPHGPPLPPGSQVQVLVRALYLNDTGTARSSYAEGVNITFYDTTTHFSFSKITPANITIVLLVVGHTYLVTATLSSSSKSTEANIGGWGGALEINVWDNGSVRKIAYSNLMP